MSYCLNPQCPQPQNHTHERFCTSCGTRLLLGDRYRALERISTGGIGRTFRGIDEGQPQKNPCIIKQVALRQHSMSSIEKAQQVFLKEALKLQELGRHPQIPQLLAYIEPEVAPGQMPALVQEWIEGQTVGEEGRYDEAAAYELLHHVLPVLQFIHDRNVIHRDINPQNLLRPNQPIANAPVFLVDLSTAKVTTKTNLAKTGTALGSAAYAAPEQLRGKAVFASDLYSLGMTCIYLLTQIHPFEFYASTEGSAVWADFLTEPISPRLRGILNKMIVEGLGDRYASAAEVYYDLHAGAILKVPEFPASSEATLAPRWRCVRTLTGHLSSVHAIAFHPYESLIASSSADRTIKLWNPDSSQETATLTGHHSIVAALAYSPDGELLISSSWDYMLRVWQDEVEIRTLTAHTGWVSTLDISPDGKFLVSGSADKTIKLWNLANGELLDTFDGHQGDVDSVAIAPFSVSRNPGDIKGILASGSADGTIKLWNLATGKELRTLSDREKSTNALLFSPSGQLLISGSTDATLKIWSLQDGAIIRTLSGHEAPINALALNREGNLLISASSDGTAKLWHPASGRLLQTLDEHEAGVLGVAISPDGQTIATASQDKTIKLWQFE